MRFMLLLKGDPQIDTGSDTGSDAGSDAGSDTAAGAVVAGPSGPMPPEELINGMLRYNEDLVKAGVLLAAEGLFDSSRGSRVIYRDGRKSVVDGPFAEAKELVAGFYIIQVSSKEEAIEWAKRCPVEIAARGAGMEAVVEVRQIAEFDEVATGNAEQRAAEQRIREQVPNI